MCQFNKEPRFARGIKGDKHPTTMKFTAISAALQAGGRLHAFLSGGGLRVVRIDQGGKPLGYGEHPDVEEALSHLEEDTAAGGRPYGEVYGGSKPHYLTGSNSTSSDLDAWLRQGKKFDAWFEDGQFVFELRGMKQTEIPKDVVSRVVETGREETWKDARGYTYKSGRSQGGGVTTKVDDMPVGGSNMRAWMYDVTRICRAATLEEAMAKVWGAEEVEASEAK